MKRKVMITGAARSGTSMMMGILRRKLGYTAHNEAHFFTLLAQLLQLTEQHKHFLQNGFRDPALVLAGDPKVTVERDLKAMFKNYVSEIYGDQTWAMKTPNSNAIRALPLMTEMFPEAKLIYLKRRGVENVLSRTRKFGSGNFRESFCKEWASCITEFFTRDVARNSLVVDQLAYMECPDAVIDRLFSFLEIDDPDQRLKANVKTFLTTKPLENTAKLTPQYIALEDTPWSADEKAIFLKHCEHAMRLAGYPISRSEIAAFQPNESFYFSGNFKQTIKVSKVFTKWNRIPADLSRPFHLHPNAVGEEPLTIHLAPDAQQLYVDLEMVNNRLTEKGVTLCIDEVDPEDRLIRTIRELNLRSLEKKRISLEVRSPGGLVRIQLKNEAGSANYNYKSLKMRVRTEAEGAE